MRAPEAYIAWINEHLGFNPRSQANSDALSDFVIADLRQSCKALDRAMSSGNLVPSKNYTVRTKVAGRSVDLVFKEKNAEKIVSVRLSVEHKSIMTAHGKARMNRYGDIIAYCNHAHNHRRDCIAAATVVVNVSPEHENPDTFARGLMRPRFDIKKVVEDTVAIFTGIPLRNSPEDPNDEPEALAVMLVYYDGINPSRPVTEPPTPQPGSPAHYQSFVGRICELYERRFSGR